MEKLTSDIVLEILSRLPKTNTGFKSSLQCREVCRLWRNLLGKPKKGMVFVTWAKYDMKLYYREKSSEMVNSCCTEEPQNFYKMVTEISTLETGYWFFRFVGTCNGLVCYVISKLIFIYNPITGERISVPNIGCVPDIGTDPGAVGFGYCRSTKTYKLVKIGQSYVAKQTVNVYTLGDGSGWRCKPAVSFDLQESGVLANGALHWLIKKRSSSYHCDIVAFDLADETFRCLPSPPCKPKSDRDVNIGSCGANLYLSYFLVRKGKV
ncbi:hypothetical protein MKW92_001070 [Papaver armeniacum]|nr:hypothetical protein MKW92_001070 [Papaver armeniacum]